MTKKIIKCRQELYNYDLDGNLSELLQKTTDWCMKFGENAVIEFIAEGGYYDEPQVKAEIRWEREETNDERDKRLFKAERVREAVEKAKKTREENRKKAQLLKEAEERKQYERLKKKFEK